MDSYPTKVIGGMEPKQNRYPLHVFHPTLQKFLQEGIDTLQWDHNYSCAAMMAALAHAIGTSFSAKVRERHIEPSILWTIIVGQRGSNKTHSVDDIFKPFQVRDAKLNQSYKQQVKEFNASDKNGEPPEKFMASVTTNTTLEGLADAMSKIPKGILLLNDEVLSLTDNLNRYTKNSNNEPYLLSSWNGAPLNSTRKTQDTIYVDKSCINIFGGVQPELTRQLISEKRLFSGFADRVLFACSQDESKPWETEREFDDELYQEYERITNQLCDVPANHSILEYAQDAKDRLMAWQSENNDRANQYRKENNFLFGTLKKYESCVCRLSLVLEVSSAYFDNRKPNSISLQSVEGAIETVEYHLQQFRQVLGLTDRDPALVSLSQDHYLLYSKLPAQFCRIDAITLAQKLEIALHDRTVDKFLSDGKYFNHPKHNCYIKRV